MGEIEVSTIPDTEMDITTMQAFAEEFGQIHNAKVNIRPLTWNAAWMELFSVASRGKGPDVSHIGSSWLSSLAMMGVLRPFKRDEIEVLGGSSAFMPPLWQSTKLHNDDVIWSIPWTSHFYVICYRKDFLKQAGVSEARAFSNIASFRETVFKLRQAGFETPWLNPTITPPYTDYVHTCASWVWNAGGYFVDPTGKRIVLDSPEARTGLVAWLDTYLTGSGTHESVTNDIVLDPFTQGRAAAVLTDMRTAASLIGNQVNQIKPENLGVTNLTNAPWCGGNSLVIWNHTRNQLERERLAVAFVQFMTSKVNNVLWTQQTGAMPARIDALNELYPLMHPIRLAVTLASRHGRCHPSIPVWRRIEHQIAQTLSDVVCSVQKDNTQNLEALVQNSITPLVRRLNLALES